MLKNSNNSSEIVSYITVFIFHCFQYFTNVCLHLLILPTLIMYTFLIFQKSLFSLLRITKIKKIIK